MLCDRSSCASSPISFVHAGGQHPPRRDGRRRGHALLHGYLHLHGGRRRPRPGPRPRRVTAQRQSPYESASPSSEDNALPPWFCRAVRSPASERLSLAEQGVRGAAGHLGALRADDGQGRGPHLRRRRRGEAVWVAHRQVSPTVLRHEQTARLRCVDSASARRGSTMPVLSHRRRGGWTPVTCGRCRS
jgi:hypothetical protein